MANAFGGGNDHALYVPLTDDEQETLSRIIEDHGLVVHIVGWGQAVPVVAFGDLRLTVTLADLCFQKPAVPVPVHYVDLELRTREGLLLFKDRQSTCYGGQPTPFGGGIVMDLIWHIQITSMAPELVKHIKPGAKGLTSLSIDPLTGRFEGMGNMRLTEDKQRMLAYLRRQEAAVAQYQRALAERAVAREDEAVERGEIRRLGN